METADSTPLPEPCDEDEELTAAHYPLEGGPPTVHSRARPVAPGVSKQLILRGAGEPPASEDKCFEPAHRRGLGLALLSMRPGERALVRVSSEGAYGAAGSFSFPSVAPGTDLLYDLQLLSVERVGGERAVRLRADMVWEERMAAAARYREAGNEAFRAGDSRGAATAYEAGMSFVDDGMMAQLMGHYLDDSSALKGSLHLNLAACSLRAGEAEEALAHSRAALALLPGNAKALYRQGRAHAALGQDDSARAALLKAQKADPEDAAVRTALRELDEEERRKAAASSRLFTGLFGAPAPPAKESGEAAGAGETVQPEPPKQAERQAPPAKAGWGLSRATAWFAS